ncbi:MAG: hypothetical protein JW712_13565 [Dehalococcoidales bacterium]|nr:hypothetical protein [Dehalococcoidales bacterium]
MMTQLGRNAGYEFRQVLTHSSQEDFSDRQKEAWDMIRESIDRGMPCYGFELEAPEYYVINGYNDTGYFYSGPSGKPDNPLIPWQDLGSSDIGILEVYSIRPGKPADDEKTIKEALEFALEYAQGPEKWVFPNYRSGIAGYDIWIETLEEGLADGTGMAYNTGVWAECRVYAERFLREASRRLNGDVRGLLHDAADAYSDVAENLAKVSEFLPFPIGNEINDPKICRKAATYLRSARESEKTGLELLGKIVESL